VDLSNLDAPSFGIPDLLWVTVISAVIALLLAVPVAVGVALFLTQYAPKRLAAPFAYLVDLLAAVPSIIYGLWGYAVLRPFVDPVQGFLSGHPRVRPGVQGQGRQRHDLPRQHRARDHDPADRHGDQPRGLRPDAATHKEGAYALGATALGDDPDRGAPVRPGRRHLRPRCSASGARSARRSPSRSS
jgi:hypothetical protein